METIIIFNEEDDFATVTTVSKKVANRFIKGGHVPKILDVDSYRFEVPKRGIKILLKNEKRKSIYPAGKND